MRILHISCSYLPDNIGGTEVYVHNLSQELALRGHDVFINYIDGFREENGPKVRTKEYIFDGLPVFIIEKNTFGLKTAELYFNIGEKIYPFFKEYLKRIQPDIVHFHHFSPAEVIVQMKAAKEMKLPVILTYHTPMMTCGHSDMLYLGKRLCDGKIDYKKCLICAQTEYNILFCVAWIWASLPKNIARCLGKFVSNVRLKSRFATWLQLPWLTRERIDRWKLGFNMVDHFVAVCQWVYELLAINGIPVEQITLSRQGINPQNIKITREPKKDALCLGYLGRLDKVKGIDVLIDAFQKLPKDWSIELHIYAVITNYQKDEIYYNKLRHKTFNDRRILWLSAVSDEQEKYKILSKFDCLIIPSIWLETGPLVLLEAWAVGTPVIGTRCGGIAELVTEEVNGLLFRHKESKDLARVITRIYKEPYLLDKLKAGIPKVRTMKEVADDMENLYQRFIRGITGL